MAEPQQFGRLWAVAPSLLALFERLAEVAKTEASVIIEGETGTGKELVAEAIHEYSARADKPYVVVDCASVPPDLIESEMFGHIKGAFTGAVTDRKGAFEAADGGTIFIDEIGELPGELQPRLLRVLEKQEIKQVGGNITSTVDVRVISATNRDLKREVEDGRFRGDLYYRLNVIKLRIPPLRERPEDILFLADHFLSEFPSFDGPIKLRDDTKKKFAEYSWPGNVRELRNLIDRGAAMSDKFFRLPEDFGQQVDLHTEVGAAPGSGVGLVEDIHSEPAQTRSTSTTEDAAPARSPSSLSVGELTRPLWEGKSYKEAKEAVMSDFERGYIAALLDAHGGNVSAAARAAGIHRNILHRMMARYGISR